MNISQPRDQPGELRRYFEVLWGRRLTILILAGALTAAAFLSSILKPESVAVDAPTSSTSTAEVVVRPMPAGLEGQTLSPNLETEKQILESPATVEPAAGRLDTNMTAETILEGLSVELLPGTEVLRVSFSSSDAEEAEEVLSAVIKEYVTARNEQATSILSGFEEVLESRRQSLEFTLRELERRISRAAAEGNRTEARILQSQRGAFFLRLESMDEQLARVESRRYEEFGAAVLQPATTPSPATTEPPSSRAVGSNVALGLALGLLLGATVALLQAFVDRRLYTRDEVESSLGLPVLGILPAAVDRGKRWDASINKLTAAVMNSLNGMGGSALVLTSTADRAGTTTVATHIAQALSRSKLTTLVCIDPSTLEEGIDTSTLDVVQVAPDSLGRDAQSASAFLADLQTGDRWVVIDAPATTIEGDAVALSSASAAILLVLRAGAVAEREALEAIAEIRAAGGDAIGVVLTFGPRVSRRL